jgi:hypothetical protein
MNIIDKALCAVSPCYKERHFLDLKKSDNDDAVTAIFKKYIVNTDLFAASWNGKFSARLNDTIWLEGSWGSTSGGWSSHAYYQMAVFHASKDQEDQQSVFNSEDSYSKLEARKNNHEEITAEEKRNDLTVLHHTRDYLGYYKDSTLDENIVVLQMAETLKDISLALKKGEMKFDIKPAALELVA